MREISLTQNKVTIVDEEDYEYLNKYKWYAMRNRTTWYATRRNYKKTIYMHRIILNVSDGILVDHKDSNGLNNSKSNLRPCNRSENHWHGSGTKSKSGYRGVRRANSKSEIWWAKINVYGKMIYLGHYKTKEDAARARDAAAIKYHGEFATLNFPAQEHTCQP